MTEESAAPGWLGWLGSLGSSRASRSSRASAALLAASCCCCALLLALAAARRARFLLRLRAVPGPRALPVLGNALQLTGTQEDFFQLLRRCADRFGAVFCLWVGTRPFVFLQSAEAVQPILNSSVHIDKSPDYRFVEAWVGKGLVTSTGERWRARRKLLTPSFHSRVLDQFLQPLHREARVLADKLAAHCGGAPFDIVPYAKLAALDVICGEQHAGERRGAPGSAGERREDTALGKHVAAQRNSNNAYVVAIDRITSIVQRRFITPWLKPDVLFNLSELGRAQRKCVSVIHGFTGRVFAARKEEKRREWEQEQLEAQQRPRGPQVADKPRGAAGGRRALLDLLLDMAHHGANLSDEDIREEVDTFTFAGHDTTAAGLSWCLYVLGKHPEVQERILDEWRSVRSTPGAECEATVGDLSRLEYLERCIKEVLRLYPVVPLIARDIRSPVHLGALGADLPAGCTVLVNAFLLHRDPRFFPEPERFDPDRFLDDSDARRHPFAYVPFSAGSRNCIGQKFAMLELKVLLLTVLERFRVQTAEPNRPLRLVAELVLSNVGGIKISLSKRSS
ncbi:Cytochrome P450 4c3 [Frankliniella fusca]|uniref:Cytochrome P450 4c3 n=1 Tax=Frankliniella fusca TaxID=407009 RepID=A0AAE1H911_9NEOP|nr:Cytochrome P450 4c3 [Frankliniella fusca]